MAHERDNFPGAYGGGFETGAGRQRARRPQTDYGTSYIQFMRHRRKDKILLEQERPSPSYMVDMLPPAARLNRPADTIPVKHLHTSLNKIKHPVNVVNWTPEGRRLLTGSSSGEFTLWNGMGFNFETIMQAHDSAIRSAVWSHGDDWLISADHDGILKYWQPNFNNVKAIQAHDLAIRELAFSPTDIKFVSASDDSTLKIWDFAAGVEESTLTGHGWDAKTVDWHPSKGLLVSGSKDHQVKLWDPRSGRCLTTLHGHKSPISKTAFEPTRGLLLATCAKDQTARIFDLRMMRDVLLLRGHEKDIVTLCWHPIHSSLLSTTGMDGSLYHYLLDEPNPPQGIAMSASPYNSPDPQNAPVQTIYPAHRIQYAHESAIWSLAWHPLGHILASGSNDRLTRFWSRARPGDVDCFNDRYHLGEEGAEAHGTWSRRHQRTQLKEEAEQEAEDEAECLVDQSMPTRQPVLPGLPGISATVLKDGTSVSGAQSQVSMSGDISSAPIIPAIPSPSFSHNQLQVPTAFPDPSQIPDLSQLAHLFGTKVPLPPPPPILSASGNQYSSLHLQGYPGLRPPQFQNGSYPILPQSGALGNSNLLTLPQQFPEYANGEALSSINANANREGGSIGRRRAPLPSQQDSLREEMRRGKYRQNR